MRDVNARAALVCGNVQPTGTAVLLLVAGRLLAPVHLAGIDPSIDRLRPMERLLAHAAIGVPVALRPHSACHPLERSQVA
ncbi:MAG: hypothetical protein IPM29_26295 [Planctomycetes bacterium]|nr:hypothetical protein [Planctomycetota bacterium]